MDNNLKLFKRVHMLYSISINEITKMLCYGIEFCWLEGLEIFMKF